jgi:hypothetical protein
MTGMSHDAGAFLDKVLVFNGVHPQGLGRSPLGILSRQLLLLPRGLHDNIFATEEMSLCVGSA